MKCGIKASSSGISQPTKKWDRRKSMKRGKEEGFSSFENPLFRLKGWTSPWLTLP